MALTPAVCRSRDGSGAQATKCTCRSHFGDINSDFLFQRLSPERLATYLDAVDGDVERAIRLYEWNAQVSAALFEVIGHVEVVLRNAIHEQMTEWCRANGHDENWFLNGHGFLDRPALRDIAKAQLILNRSGHEVTSDRFVSTLNFGFWRYLMTNRYRTTLWPLVVRRAFPSLRVSESILFNSVGRLHVLRNRLAHHEAVFFRHLEQDLRDAYLVARAIDPQVEQWIRSQSRVEALLEIRP